MPGMLCFFSLFVVVAASVWMLRLVLGARATGGLEDWGTFVSAWNRVGWGGKCTLFLLMAGVIFFRCGKWAVFGAAVSGMFGAVVAICGADSASVPREIRKILQDLYRFVKELKGVSGSAIINTFRSRSVSLAHLSID